ncbi:MAG: DUF4363 family protein [Oscillospiraceae bacterium]|jgi:hypothetical protein|nr:DUF4363 family protein [Oscillospiraceae bacterium]
MKRKIMSIAITLPILLGLGLFSMLYTRDISDHYVAMAEELRDAAEADDWELARQQMDAIYEDWRSREGILQIWVPHRDTDEVQKQMEGMQAGLAIRDKSLMMEHAAGLIEALDHLHHRDDLSISNIL